MSKMMILLVALLCAVATNGERVLDDHVMLESISSTQSSSCLTCRYLSTYVWRWIDEMDNETLMREKEPAMVLPITVPTANFAIKRLVSLQNETGPPMHYAVIGFDPFYEHYVLGTFNRARRHLYAIKTSSSPIVQLRLRPHPVDNLYTLEWIEENFPDGRMRNQCRGYVYNRLHLNLYDNTAMSRVYKICAAVPIDEMRFATPLFMRDKFVLLKYNEHTKSVTSVRYGPMSADTSVTPLKMDCDSPFFEHVPMCGGAFGRVTVVSVRCRLFEQAQYFAITEDDKWLNVTLKLQQSSLTNQAAMDAHLGSGIAMWKSNGLFFGHMLPSERVVITHTDQTLHVKALTTETLINRAAQGINLSFDQMRFVDATNVSDDDMEKTEWTFFKAPPSDIDNTIIPITTPKLDVTISIESKRESIDDETYIWYMVGFISFGALVSVIVIIAILLLFCM